MKSEIEQKDIQEQLNLWIDGCRMGGGIQSWCVADCDAKLRCKLVANLLPKILDKHFVKSASRP